MSAGTRPLAVVTGASSGIGTELARRAAGDGYHVVVIARRKDRLAALCSSPAEGHGPMTPLVVDLSTPHGPRQVFDALPDQPVEVLVNNAGVGGHGRFAVERDLQADLAMIQLDVTSLVELTGLLLPGMLARRRGWILNVASIAGYLPGPGQAVYHAGKAFVRSFSAALAEETRGSGVHVTTLSPGPVDTEFARTASYPGGPPRPPAPMPVLSATQVADAAWDGLMAGRSAVVPDRATRIGLQALRFLPWRLVARTTAPEHPPR